MSLSQSATLISQKSGGGYPARGNPLARLVKGIFFISLAISLYGFVSADIDTVAAVFLALATSAVLALVPVIAIWLWLRRQARKTKSNGSKPD